MRIRHTLFLGAVGFFVLFAFVSSYLWAGNTGKIVGRVVDKETKEGVVGATVRVDGTSLGAASDAEGKFFILSVPPGKYRVTITGVGYISLGVTNVTVVTDQTTDLGTLKVEPSAIEMPAQKVVGAPPLINPNVTANVRNLSAEDIKNLPVKTVEDLLRLQVGVTKQGDVIHVRGGRGNEILYVVDGVEVRDPLGGRGPVGQALNVASTSIEELSIIKGGFDAEYGNAQSAVVNISTKEGEVKTTRGHIEYFTDDFGSSSLDKYSYNFDRLEASLSGPDPFLTTRFLPALGISGLEDKLTYFLSADADKTDTYLSFAKLASPTTQPTFRNYRFLGLNIPDRQQNSYTTNMKITYKATPNLRFALNYKGSWDRYHNYQPGAGAGGTGGWYYRYSPFTQALNREWGSVYSLNATHNVSKNTFYQVVLSRFFRRYFEAPSDPNRPGEVLLPNQFRLADTQYEVYDDLNHNGHWDDPEPFTDLNHDGRYTFGDVFDDQNGNGKYDPGIDILLWDWNRNGQYDQTEGEPFVDLNGNGVRDAGDNLRVDLNGNGRYDDRYRPVQSWGGSFADRPEPYQDGDISLGEPFEDRNHNGVFDPGVDEQKICACPENQDLNRNSKYDGPKDPWTPGVPYLDVNHNGRYDPPNKRYDRGEAFVDVNGDSKWNPTDLFLDPGTFEIRGIYEQRTVTLTTAAFDITSQFKKSHEVKTGLKLEKNRLTMQDIRYVEVPYDGPPDPTQPINDRGIFRDFYDRSPIRLATYVQDKIEYGALIARLGLRYERFLQANLNDLRKEREDAGLIDTVIARNRSKLAPRMGFSYPITERAKIYFNYGHFYQLPEFQYFYRRSTQGSLAFGIIGNFNLDFSKQISYEFGVNIALSNSYKLDVSGFFKDYFGQINTLVQRNGPIERDIYANLDYARTRGFELELDKKYGNYISGYVNYQFAYAFGKASTESQNYNDRFNNRQIPIKENPLSWDQRHQITFNLDLRIPRKERPRIFGLRVPDNWGINVVWQYGSGFPFTPTRTFPGLRVPPGEQPQVNSMRIPSSSQVDFRFNKDFEVWKLNYSFEVWVNNVFNRQNISSVYTNTGFADTGNQPSSSAIEPGTDYQRRPDYFGPGRNVRLGLALNF